MAIVQAEATKPGAPEILVNWLKHKDSNSWVLKCLCFPLTSMKPTDWIATSFTTNVAESAHALSQRYGKQLSLMAAIEAGQKLDGQHFELKKVVQHSGLRSMYGNGNATGRIKKNLNRQRARAETTKKGKKNEATEKVLMEARSLLEADVSKEAVEEFLAAKAKS
jgi:hypothetical protein